MDKKPEKLVPEVRFKGFTDDWEQRKLSTLVTLHARIGWQNLRTSEFLDSGNYMLITGTDFNNGKIDYSKVHYVEKNRYDQDPKLQLHNGNILITKDGTIGKVAYVDRLKMPATLNAGIFNVTIKNKDETNNKYLFNYLNAPFLMKYATAESTGGTIKHLNQKVLVNFPVPISSIKEQNKISNLLEIINKLLSLQQRKLEQLKLLEKALQQKLFPNSFQEKPLLRILHGDNSWWNSYIGEVFTERVDKGSSEKLLSVSITDGVYPFDESKRKNNSSDDKHNYKKVFQNDIAYNSMRLWQGALGVSKYEGIVSPAYTVLKPLPNQNSIFYEFMFKNIDMLHIFQRNSQGLTSDTWNLKFNQLQHIKIKTTNLNSQNKIAKLLIKIEELKNNESNYYHNLMTLKKYLLQKLFI